MASVESHKHRLAKELLAEWIVLGLHGRAPGIPYACGDASNSRVFLEYPICFQKSGAPNGLDVLWDEDSWEGETGIYGENGALVPLGAVPTYEQLCTANNPPAVIVDIAITRKGNISACIEVVHKSAITSHKLERLKMLQQECPCGGFEVWTVPADWILGQVGVPAKFVGERLISSWNGCIQTAAQWRVIALGKPIVDGFLSGDTPQR